MLIFFLITPYVCLAEEGVSSLAELYQQAEQGHPTAQYKLGRLYAAPATPVSHPINPGIRPRYPFLQWIQAVQQDNPDLDPDQISQAYVDRYGPPPQEEIEPLEAFQARAKTMYPDQSDIQIRNYYNSIFGVAQRAWEAKLKNDGLGLSQDYEKARAWYLKAAQQGHAAAQYSVGWLYAEGRGIPQDDVEAYAWANIAAAQGDSKAIGLRNRLRKKLASDSLFKAQALSKKYYEKYVVPFR